MRENTPFSQSAGIQKRRLLCTKNEWSCSQFAWAPRRSWRKQNRAPQRSCAKGFWFQLQQSTGRVSCNKSLPFTSYSKQDLTKLIFHHHMASSQGVAGFFRVCRHRGLIKNAWGKPTETAVILWSKSPDLWSGQWREYFGGDRRGASDVSRFTHHAVPAHHKKTLGWRDKSQLVSDPLTNHWCHPKNSHGKTFMISSGRKCISLMGS